MRNAAVYETFDIVATPLRQKINSYRSRWGLTPLRSLYETGSPVLQLAQQTADFDFPRTPLPQFQYHRLIRREGSAKVAFPFERLDGRPIVYASLGTVTSDGQGLFRLLAEACAGLGAQLVITLGGKGSLAGYTDLPGQPVVVDYAPQLAILQRAAATVAMPATTPCWSRFLAECPYWRLRSTEINTESRRGWSIRAPVNASTRSG